MYKSSSHDIPSWGYHPMGPAAVLQIPTPEPPSGGGVGCQHEHWDATLRRDGLETLKMMREVKKKTNKNWEKESGKKRSDDDDDDDDDDEDDDEEGSDRSDRSDQLTKGILVEIDCFVGGVIIMLPSYSRTGRIFMKQSGFHGMSRVLKVAEMMKSHHVCEVGVAVIVSSRDFIIELHVAWMDERFLKTSFKNTNRLAILGDLFGMVKGPFQRMLVTSSVWE